MLHDFNFYFTVDFPNLQILSSNTWDGWYSHWVTSTPLVKENEGKIGIELRPYWVETNMQYRGVE